MGSAVQTIGPSPSCPGQWGRQARLTGARTTQREAGKARPSPGPTTGSLAQGTAEAKAAKGLHFPASPKAWEVSHWKI